MAKQNILIVDADPESVHVLEVSLKKAGYSVTKAENGVAAIEIIGFSIPDLIISDTKMPQMDGFEFCMTLKENEAWVDIPFIFLTADKSIEDKIRGLELGVDDYLNKPIFIREMLARVSLGIQRRQKERLEHRGTKTKFSGNLQDMGVVDLLQTIDLGHKSGVIHLMQENDNGEIFFQDGHVIDAHTCRRSGADAVYRMLVWSAGTFEIEFKNPEKEQRIDLSTQGLLMEGMRRVDEWGRLQEQLPSLVSVFDVEDETLAARLGEIPDEVNAVLKHFDGRSTLMEIVDRGSLGDLEAFTVISKLYFEGLIFEVPKEPQEEMNADVTHFRGESEGIRPADHDLSDQFPHMINDIAHLPSRVVDDVIGPHMSMAVRNLGFVEALTHAPGVAAPPVNMPNTDPGNREQPEPTIKQAQTGDTGDTGDGKHIGTMPRIAVPPFASNRHQAMSEPAVEIPTKPESRASAIGEGRLSTAAKRDSLIATAAHDSAGSIAYSEAPRAAAKSGASLDATMPPHAEMDTPVDEREERPEYVEAVTHKASVKESSSYEPRTITDSPPEKIAHHPDKEDLYGEEIEEGEQDDDWEEPSMRLRYFVIFAAAVLLIGGGGFAAYWYWQRDRAEKLFDAAPIINTPSKQYQSALHVKKDPSSSRVTPSVSAPPEVPAPALAGVDKVTDALTPEARQGTQDNALAKQQVAAVPAAVAAPPASGTPVVASEPTPVAVGPDAIGSYEGIMNKAAKSAGKKKISLLREALTYNPNGDDALARLAIELMENKKTRDEALTFANRAVTINSDNAIGWMAVGYIHQLNNDNTSAKAAYKKCADASGPKNYKNECRRLAR